MTSFRWMKQRARWRCTDPDGVPDAVQQVKHGALNILAQFKNIGHTIRGTHDGSAAVYALGRREHED